MKARHQKIDREEQSRFRMLQTLVSKHTRRHDPKVELMCVFKILNNEEAECTHNGNCQILYSLLAIPHLSSAYSKSHLQTTSNQDESVQTSQLPIQKRTRLMPSFVIHRSVYAVTHKER